MFLHLFSISIVPSKIPFWRVWQCYCHMKDRARLTKVSLQKILLLPCFLHPPVGFVTQRPSYPPGRSSLTLPILCSISCLSRVALRSPQRRESRRPKTEICWFLFLMRPGLRLKGQIDYPRLVHHVSHSYLHQFREIHKPSVIGSDIITSPFPNKYVIVSVPINIFRNSNRTAKPVIRDRTGKCVDRRALSNREGAWCQQSTGG